MAERATSLTAVLVLGAFLAGGFAYSRDVFPFPHIRQLRDRLTDKPDAEPPRFVVDRAGRVMADRRKEQTPCAPAGKRTAVLLIAGQSNAANFAGQAYRSDYGGRVQNFLGGTCFVAASPLLGGDFFDGEYWTRTGNLLIESGAFDQVVLAVAAVGGTPIARWTPGGDLHSLLTQTVTDLKAAGLSPTHFRWVQGENDLLEDTPKNVYTQLFLAMIDAVRAGQPTLPVFPGVATFCEPFGTANRKDNPVADAQRALPDATKNIFAGVDTDRLLDLQDRRDACHFGGSGSEKAAQAWAKIISAHAPR